MTKRKPATTMTTSARLPMSHRPCSTTETKSPASSQAPAPAPPPQVRPAAGTEEDPKMLVIITGRAETCASATRGEKTPRRTGARERVSRVMGLADECCDNRVRRHHNDEDDERGEEHPLRTLFPLVIRKG